LGEVALNPDLPQPVGPLVGVGGVLHE
jgi:hypothetical protein